MRQLPVVPLHWVHKMSPVYHHARADTAPRDFGLDACVTFG